MGARLQLQFLLAEKAFDLENSISIGRHKTALRFLYLVHFYREVPEKSILVNAGQMLTPI